MRIRTFIKTGTDGGPIAAVWPGERRAGRGRQCGCHCRQLRQALCHRWLASELSHVILKYESEWSGNMSRWEALTANMRNAAENWTCELERIKNLQWWDSVAGKVEGFPSSPVVNHIHPVAVLGNFHSVGSKITISILRKIWPSALFPMQTWSI